MSTSHTAMAAPLPRATPAQSCWLLHPAVSVRTPARLYGAYATLVVLLLLLWPTAWSGRQMLLHIVTMAVAAPLAAGLLRWCRRLEAQTRPLHLWMAMAVQMAAFLFWHSPFGMALAMRGVAGAVLLQSSLLVAASLFWWCMAGLGRGQIWHGIAALLVTGKLFCLVAVIFVFAPRPLYHMMTLPDQQLAGLIMITLCPLTYVASALWLCWHWLRGIKQPGPGARHTPT